MGATVFVYCTFSRREPYASYTGHIKRCDALAALFPGYSVKRFARAAKSSTTMSQSG